MAVPNTLRYTSVPGYRRITRSGSTTEESRTLTLFERDDRNPSEPTKSVPELSGWRDPKPYERAVGQGVWFPQVEFAADLMWTGSYPGPQHLECKLSGKVNGILDDLTRHPSGASSNALKGRAVNAALSGLKQSNVNLAVAFGERKETAEFVGDCLRVTADVFKAVRRRDVKKLKKILLNRDGSGKSYRSAVHRVLDKPSSLLLQNAYAVTPLVSDIYGVMDELNAKDLKDPKRYALTSHGKAHVKNIISAKGRMSIYSGVIADIVERTEVHEGYVCRLDAYIENELLVSLASLGVTNPALVAWELVPFSFVVDWALPIGSYLETIDASTGIKFRGGSLSHRKQWKRKFDVVGISSTNSYMSVLDYDIVDRTNTALFTDFQRSVYTDFPSPVMVSFKNPLSTSHVKNALALLVQLTKKR